MLSIRTLRENERLKKQVRDLEDRLLNLTEEKVDIEAHLKERLKNEDAGQKERRFRELQYFKSLYKEEEIGR